MPNALRMSSYIYSLLLASYPRELRQRFGGEMTQVFADQISEAWARRGVFGVVRVWLTAGWEVISVAAPLQMRNPVLIASALSFVSSSVLFLAFFRAVSP